MSFADRTETVTRFFEDMCVCCCGKGVAQGWTEMSTSYKKSLQPRKLTHTHTHTASLERGHRFCHRPYYVAAMLLVYVVGGVCSTVVVEVDRRRCIFVGT